MNAAIFYCVIRTWTNEHIDSIFGAKTEPSKKPVSKSHRLHTGFLPGSVLAPNIGGGRECSLETVVHIQTTRCYISEDGNIHMLFNLYMTSLQLCQQLSLRKILARIKIISVHCYLMNPRRMLLSENSKLSTLPVIGSSCAYDDPYMVSWFVVPYGCPVPNGTCPYGGAVGGGATNPGAGVYGGR
jgi:hypothetical protein